MGTNYYLRRKIDLHKAHLNNKLPYNIQVLNNGFVWNQTYYPDLNSLEPHYYQELHIGKSSFGWLFLLQEYPYRHDYEFSDNMHLDEEFRTIEDYINEYKKPSTIGLYNEYGEEESLDEFMKIFNREYEKDVPERADKCEYDISEYKHLCYNKSFDSSLKYYNGVPYRTSAHGDFC